MCEILWVTIKNVWNEKSACQLTENTNAMALLNQSHEKKLKIEIRARGYDDISNSMLEESLIGVKDHLTTIDGGMI